MEQVKEGLINTEYSTVDFSSTDIKENIFRPSFYVEFYENKSGKFNANNKERTLQLKIHYYATDRTKCKIELIEIQDILENVFLAVVKAKDDNNIPYNIPVNEIAFEIDKQQGFLTADMELHTIELIPDTGTEPYMDTLELNM